MSQIFELFGYPLTDRSKEAESCRRAARCPFMGVDCDGGGNRYLSAIDLTDERVSQELKAYFPERSTVQSGVCALQLRPDERPWIVCPRRLLFLGKSGVKTDRQHQSFVEGLLLHHCELVSPVRLGVWSEVKMMYREGQKSFNYTFDYIVMPLGRLKSDEAEAASNVPWKELRRGLEKAGYSLARRKNIDYVEDYPVGSPVIVEVMTSSTSGGNKDKRTTIPMSFEDAVLGKPHVGPGINYRQVWARMVSQLIVKSEVGLGWGGKTFWILQDVLVDYISSSTALDIRQFLTERVSEVNILAFSYGKAHKKQRGINELKDGALLSGPVSSSSDTASPSFQDMIRAPVVPPKSELIRALTKRGPVNIITIP